MIRTVRIFFFVIASHRCIRSFYFVQPFSGVYLPVAWYTLRIYLNYFIKILFWKIKGVSETKEKEDPVFNTVVSSVVSWRFS